MKRKTTGLIYLCYVCLVMVVPGESLQVHVLSEDGEPLNGIEIYVAPKIKTSQDAVRSIGRSDTNGLVTANNLVVDEYVLGVANETCGYFGSTNIVLSLVEEDEIRFFPNEFVKFRGRVVDTNGVPVSGMRVYYLQPYEPNEISSKYATSSITGTNGYFDAVKLKTLKGVSVVARSNGWQIEQCDIDPDSDNILIAHKAPSSPTVKIVKFRLIDENGDLLDIDGSCFAKNSDGTSYAYVDNGLFELRGIPFGEYHIEIKNKNGLALKLRNKTVFLQKNSDNFDLVVVGEKGAP